MNGELDSGFTILRTTVEAALEVPLAVTVTSARPGDGKTEIAAGLARAFAAAGYRTIVVDANPASPNVGPSLGIGRLRTPAALDDASALAAIKVTPFLEAASIADFALMDASSAVALRSFMEDLRGRYAVTIWDAGDAFTSSLALQCSAASEGTLVAVRFGRKPTSEDARLVSTLEGVGGRIIGIVPTGLPDERGERIGKGKRRAPAYSPDGEVAAGGVRRAGKSTA
jgi:Mrp family chromosome partitioning ATPase